MGPDIFNLGAVLYEMLTGVRAFGGASRADTLSAILKEDPPDPPSGSAIPPALARIVSRRLEKSADRQSASDLAFALESLTGDPGPMSSAHLEQARRDGGPRAGRWSARERVLGTAAIGLATALTMALGFSSSFHEVTLVQVARGGRAGRPRPLERRRPHLCRKMGRRDSARRLRAV
jgi:hypothetical protein